jgi:dTDP-4-dehydrorhamnose 3,5-epimerase
MSTEYAPAHQAGLMWNEPRIGITWPIRTPTLSERDKKWPALMPVL